MKPVKYDGAVMEVENVKEDRKFMVTSLRASVIFLLSKDL